MSVLPLATARDYLNISGSSHDLKLQSIIDAAEAVIARRCGPLSSTATTVRVNGGGAALVLPVTPALTLTSVTPVDGTALTLGDLYLDTSAGVVTYNSGTGFSDRAYTVVYNAGRSSVPADLLMGVQELVRHLWTTQRGPTTRPGSSASETTSNSVPGAAYLLPFRVSELIAPHIQPGFA